MNQLFSLFNIPTQYSDIKVEEIWKLLKNFKFYYHQRKEIILDNISLYTWQFKIDVWSCGQAQCKLLEFIINSVLNFINACHSLPMCQFTSVLSWRCGFSINIFMNTMGAHKTGLWKFLDKCCLLSDSLLFPDSHL